MALAPVPHLLILEPDVRGHAREWIAHLIEGANAVAPEPLRLSFAVPAGLAEEIDGSLPMPVRDRVVVIPLTPREAALCLHRRLWISGFARWRTMRRYLERTGATHGLFLALDHLSLPLALGLGANAKPLSGILFRPSVHYGEIGHYSPTPRERLRDLRKAVLYRLMLRNSALHAVFSLDPYFVTYARQHYPKAEKVINTPDPVYPAAEPTGTDSVLADTVPDGRRLFLMFGELTVRKGIFTLLGALERLSSEDASRIAVMVAGAVDPPIQAIVRAAVARLGRTRPELWLHLEDRRISTGEITALLRRSWVVLAPYDRFVGSSGILLWAAQARRPLLGQEYGLMGRLTHEFGLGTTTDTSDARALADSIVAIARNAVPETAATGTMATLCAAHTPGQFAGIVLGGAIQDHDDSRSGSLFERDRRSALQ